MLGRALAVVLLMVVATVGAREREGLRPQSRDAVVGHAGGFFAGLMVGVSVLLLGLTVLLVILARRRRRRDRGEERVNREVRPFSRWSFYLIWLAVAAATLLPLLLLRFLPDPDGRPGGGSGSDRTDLPAVAAPTKAVTYAVVAVALALLAVLVWRRTRPSPVTPPVVQETEDDLPAGPTRSLGAAVEAGSDALADEDDARSAVIACYAAMEGSLATAGTRRRAADTPTELLDRAVATGVVRGGAARDLTALFREARFSAHPMGGDERRRAEAALAELARDLEVRA